MDMKKTAVTCFVGVWLALGAGLAQAAALSDDDKQFLGAYEKVRSALAADDLANAKGAASDLREDGAALAKSSSLKEARIAFEKLSDKAKKIAAGQPGYYVVNCPMLKKDWIQNSEKIGNPYFGKEMASCGEIKK
jgi:predicted  nucleic acid-binding Zn-ribbon protein